VPIRTHAAIHLTGKDENVLPAVPRIHQCSLFTLLAYYDASGGFC
jgi:hypothetical protein